MRFPWQKQPEEVRTSPWPTAGDLIAQRPVQHRGQTTVTNDTALRHSAVWACLRLRANLISTLPVKLYRSVPASMGNQVELPKPPKFSNPGGERIEMEEWLYSTQIDLDRAGNDFGLITARDGFGLISQVELVPLNSVTVRVRDGQIAEYRIDQKAYTPDQVWHEKQYTVAGLHVGLSPVAYGAWSIGEYLSIQEFATDWFSKGGIPAAELKNVARTIGPTEAAQAKQYFKASVSAGDLFVHGSDWEYNMIQADQTGRDWIDAKQYGLNDVARFFDCPGDLIDAVVTSGHITYASITQRNLQFLIMHMAPAIIRREKALSTWVPAQQFVKLNSDALLRLDPVSRADMISTQIASKVLAPSEARELDDRPPFTEAQLAEFDRLFPVTAAPAAGGPTPKGSV